VAPKKEILMGMETSNFSQSLKMTTLIFMITMMVWDLRNSPLETIYILTKTVFRFMTVHY